MIVRNRKQTEAGYVLVTVAGLLVVLVGFSALAIDTGILFGARTQAQRAADAAALAGALTFINTRNASQPETARKHAIAAARNNKVMGNVITSDQVPPLVDGKPNPDVVLPDPDLGVSGKVTVTITISDVPIFFAKILGVTGVTEVHATAEAGNGATSAYIKPFFLSNTTFARDGAGNPRAACAVCAEICGDYNTPANSGNCSIKNYSTGQVLVDTVAGKITPFAKGKLGQQFAVRPIKSTVALDSSQFYSLQLGGNGGDIYREAISTNKTKGVCMSPGDPNGAYHVETGAMNGPTNQGVDALIGNPADQYIAIGQYRQLPGDPAGGPYHDTSDSLVTVPIWDPCITTVAGGGNFCPANAMTGGNDPAIPIIAYATLFIDRWDSNDGVVAHLINVFPCDGTGAGGSSSRAVPLRLVRID